MFNSISFEQIYCCNIFSVMYALVNWLLALSFACSIKNSTSVLSCTVKDYFFSSPATFILISMSVIFWVAIWICFFKSWNVMYAHSFWFASHILINSILFMLINCYALARLIAFVFLSFKIYECYIYTVLKYICIYFPFLQEYHYIFKFVQYINTCICKLYLVQLL